MTTRHRHGAFNRPSLFNSPSDGTISYSEFSRPLAETHSSTVARQSHIPSRVQALFFWGCPSAVARLVVAVVVDSVNAVVLRWTRTHVGEKLRKRELPGGAYSNPSPAVVSVTDAARGITAFNHLVPDCMFWVVRHSVVDHHFRCVFAIKATATEGATFYEACSKRRADRTTRTLTSPPGVPRLSHSGVANDSQSPENLPSQIFHARRNCDRIHSSHVPVSFGRRNVVRTAMQRQLRGCSYFSTSGANMEDEFAMTAMLSGGWR